MSFVSGVRLPSGHHCRQGAGRAVLLIAASWLARKALHPEEGPSWPVRGRAALGTGVTWSTTVERSAVLRLSRSVGLPKPFPDVLGWPCDSPQGEPPGDLCEPPPALAVWVASCCGRRAIGELLQLSHPYRTPTGPLLVAAVPIDDDGLRLIVCAPLRGAWSSFGWLDVLPTSDYGPEPSVL